MLTLNIVCRHKASRENQIIYQFSIICVSIIYYFINEHTHTERTKRGHVTLFVVKLLILSFFLTLTYQTHADFDYNILKLSSTKSYKSKANTS